MSHPEFSERASNTHQAARQAGLQKAASPLPAVWGCVPLLSPSSRAACNGARKKGKKEFSGTPNPGRDAALLAPLPSEWLFQNFGMTHETWLIELFKSSIVMPQQRGAFTDQLDTIVQVIELGRKTGILIVERGGGSKREEGRIDFVLGQVTDAHIGHLHGQEALNWLKTWETCRFIFEPTVVEKNTGPQPKSSPLQSTGPLQSTDPLQSTGPLKNTNPKGHIPSQETQNSQRRTPTGQPNAPSMATGPYRIRQDVDGSLRLLARAGLSRLHRRLFLLIDGHRTIPELVRLLGHSPVEVQKLLRDLETIGLIRH